MAQLIKIGSMWYSDFRMDGKRIRRALSPYKPKAKGMLNDLLALRRSEKHQGYRQENVSWNFFKLKCKDYWIKKKRSPQTIYRSELAFRMMEDSKTIYDLRQVTPELLEDLMVLWEQSGRTTSAITRAIKAIKAAMRLAENWDYIRLQNWRKVEVIEPAGRIDYYDFEPFEKLLKQVKGWVLTDCILQGRQGLRSGEVYHLEWTDIQFDREQIYFTSKPHLEWKIKGDKKGTKKRIVPLDQDVKVYLKSIARPSGFVLGHDRPHALELFYKLVQNAIKATGVLTHHGKLGSPHTLRHTFASHLISNGVSLEELKDLLGHEHIKTTEIYSHLMPHAAKNAMERLPRLCSSFVPVHDKVKAK